MLPRRRPHACDECAKAFGSKSNLRSHKLYVHKKERNYGCSVCSKLFATWQGLECHQRTHTGERPYKCNRSMCRKSVETKTQNV